MSETKGQTSSSGGPMTPFGPEQRPWIEQLPPEAFKEGEPYGTPPTINPKDAYQQSSKAYPFQERKLPDQYVQIPPIGMLTKGKESLLEQSLKKIYHYLTLQQKEFLGYQIIEKQDFDRLQPYLDMCINNIGDPFVDGFYTLNSKSAERGVMDFFASLWHAEWPSRVDSTASGDLNHSYWGYVLSMGSTEGNLYAVLSARDYLDGCKLVRDPDEPDTCGLIRPQIPAQDNPNAYTPLAFYSEDTHYSVMKAVHAMNVKTFYQEGMEKYRNECPLPDYQNTGKWPEEVPSLKPSAEYPIGPGMVDLNALKILVEFFVKRGYPPLIMLNYGTTFKGAYDDVQKAGEMLMPVLKKYGLDQRTIKYHNPVTGKLIGTDKRNGYWIHVDGALGASFMPFVEMLHNHGQVKSMGPLFDFRLSWVHSIVTSGHKWPGTPAPTGIYMSKRQYLIAPPDAPEYLGSPDSTFAGSRSGLSAMAMWIRAASGGYPEYLERAKETLDIIDYAYRKLKELSDKLKEEHDFDIWLQHTPLSMAIIFRKPIDEIMFKYSLCTADANKVWKNDKVVRTYVHMFCLWERNKKMFDDLVNDLKSPDSFDPNSERLVEQDLSAKEIGECMSSLEKIT